MIEYKCHICGGSCDPGELENGVCFDCRIEATHRQDERSCRTIRELNQLIRSRYVQQNDGQMAMRMM